MSTFPMPVERAIVFSDISTAFPKGSKTDRKNQSGDTQLGSFTIRGEKFLQPMILYLQVLRTAGFSSVNFVTTLAAFPGFTDSVVLFMRAILHLASDIFGMTFMWNLVWLPCSLTYALSRPRARSWVTCTAFLVFVNETKSSLVQLRLAKSRAVEAIWTLHAVLPLGNKSLFLASRLWIWLSWMF